MQQSPSWKSKNSSASGKIRRHCKEPEGLLPWSPKPANYPNPEPDISSSRPPVTILYNAFQYYPSSKPKSSKECLSFRFPHRTLYAPFLSPLRATRPANLFKRTHVNNSKAFSHFSHSFTKMKELRNNSLGQAMCWMWTEWLELFLVTVRKFFFVQTCLGRSIRVTGRCSVTVG